MNSRTPETNPSPPPSIVVTVGRCPCGAVDPDEYCCGIQNVGSVRAVLTGRDALVMALGRAAVEWEKRWKEPGAMEYMNRYHAALAALFAFDAAQEGDND